MKSQTGLDGPKLKFKLLTMLDQEKEIFVSRNMLKVGDKRIENMGEIRQRDAVVRWLLLVHYKLGYSPNTFDLSVAILDRFLLLVKTQPKYLRCIAISSYFLAAKCMEEDEIILATCDLVAMSNCGCSVAEILRMERIILSKLKWNPLSKTAVDFIHVLYALLTVDEDGQIQSNFATTCQLRSLIRKLYTCLCKYEVRIFQPSTVAVALISIELSYHTGNWREITKVLQNEVKLESYELVRCWRIIFRILSRTSYNHTLVQSWKSESKPCKRKVEQTELGDDVYEGIKRLYGDETSVYESMLSCGSQAVLSTAIINTTALTAVAAL